MLLQAIKFQPVKMDRFKYIFSILFVILTSLACFGQEKGNKQDEDLYAPIEDKEPLVLKGIKVGVNVGRVTDFFFKPERRSTEVSLDFNLSNKYFGVVEGGISETSMIKENYWYDSEGSYIKVGMDFNMLKKYPTDYFGIGIRIGRADFKHSASHIIFEDSHWIADPIAVDSKSYNTYWLEASFGLKGELIKNVYFGWSALVRIGVSGRKDAQFQPYEIPGFGKGANSINLGATYYIYYQIPFNKNK